MPSGTRNFFGRLVDRLLPGTNYNPTTGSYSNIGSGLAGLGLKFGTTLVAGPGAGALVGKGLDKYLKNHQGQIVPATTQGAPFGGSNFNPFNTSGFGTYGSGWGGITNPFDMGNGGFLAGNNNPFSQSFAQDPFAPSGVAQGGSTAGSSGFQGAAGFAGGGMSQGGGIGHGWTGVSGDAARGMFAGMSGASNAAQAELDRVAMARNKQ